MSIGPAIARATTLAAAAALLAGGAPGLAAAPARPAAMPAASMGPAASKKTPAASFAAVAPLLIRSCGGCHAPGRKGARDLVLFDEAGRLDRAAVRAERDWILEVVATDHGRPRLTGAEVATLRRWWEAGAPID